MKKWSVYRNQRGIGCTDVQNRIVLIKLYYLKNAYFYISVNIACDITVRAKLNADVKQKNVTAAIDVLNTRKTYENKKKKNFYYLKIVLIVKVFFKSITPTIIPIENRMNYIEILLSPSSP